MRRPAWKSRNVLALGIVSLLNDVGTEMVQPLLPLFVTATLGGGATALAVLQGAADAAASLVQVAVGARSDRSGKRKPLVLAGYAIAAIARPFLALAQTATHATLVRVGDRLGKGLRTSPRDALIASAVPPEQRGEAFGFHAAMDHVGAFLGPLAAIALLAWLGLSLRTVFLVSVIPSAAAFVAAWVLVREDGEARARATTARFVPPTRDEWRFLGPLAIASLSGAGEVLVLLRVLEVLGTDRAKWALPLAWVVLHVVKSLAAAWGGRAADRLGPRRAVAIGWGAGAVVLAGLALATSAWLVVALVLSHGVRLAFTEAPEKALVASLAPRERHGASFGAYNLVVGLVALPAAWWFGTLWDRRGTETAFAWGAASLALATIALFLLRPARRAER